MIQYCLLVRLLGLQVHVLINTHVGNNTLSISILSVIVKGYETQSRHGLPLYSISGQLTKV